MSPPTPRRRLAVGYRLPAGDLAQVRTFVNEDGAEGIYTPWDNENYHAPGEVIGPDRDRVAPQPVDTKQNLSITYLPWSPVYNTPGPSPNNTRYESGPNIGERNIHKDMARTQSQPGEEYGHPWKDNVYPRRTEASFYRETFTPGDNMDPGVGPRDIGYPGPYNPFLKTPMPNEDQIAPGHLLDEGYTEGSPSSARVIPWNKGFDTGFDNAESMSIRVAARIMDIMGGIDTDITDKAKRLRPHLRRQDGDTLFFSVGGDTGNYNVTVQTDDPDNIRDSSIKITCDCKFWTFGGPEHWAKVEDYLYGRPRGPATAPRMRDPNGVNRACKHAVSVLEYVISL